jgi:hypothetical protein
MAYITKTHKEITGIDLRLSVDEINLLIGLLLDQQIEIANHTEEAKSSEEECAIDYLIDRKEEVDELLGTLESIWSGQDCQ